MLRTWFWLFVHTRCGVPVMEHLENGIESKGLCWMKILGWGRGKRKEIFVRWTRLVQLWPSLHKIDNTFRQRPTEVSFRYHAHKSKKLALRVPRFQSGRVVFYVRNKRKVCTQMSQISIQRPKRREQVEFQQKESDTRQRINSLHNPENLLTKYFFSMSVLELLFVYS